MIVFIESNYFFSSNYINIYRNFNPISFLRKSLSKTIFGKILKEILFNLFENIQKIMAVVVYWLITAGCGPAKGSSIESFCEKASPKKYENLPDRPLFNLRGEK